MKKSRKVFLIIVHLFIAITTMYITAHGVLYGAGDGQNGEHMIYTGIFKAFTIDSNVFAAFASFIIALRLTYNLIHKKDHIPYIEVLMQYMGAISLGLTFFTSAVFLAPNSAASGNSYFEYFSDYMFFMHLFTPALSITAYIVGENEYTFGLKESFLGLIPLFIYAVIYVYCAIIKNIWTEFYGFTFGGQNQFVIPALLIIFSITWSIAVLLIRGHKRALNNKSHN